MKKTILALQPLLHNEMTDLEARFDVIRLWEERDPDAVLQEKGRDIQGVVSTFNGGGVSASLMDALPNLEIIAQYGVGYDNVDVQAAGRKSIVVTNTPDVVTDDTADMALFLTLAVARRTVEADMLVRVGRWQSSIPYMGVSVSGKKAGIVGLGKIGQAIASRAAAFNMDILYHTRSKKDVPYTYYDDLKAMARDADFLILACAGNAQTAGLIDYSVMEALGSKGYLINIARGSVVKEDDLLAALSNKAIAGAGLDVFADEPNVPEAMFTMDNVVLSPHIGGGTYETRSAMGRLVIENLVAHFNGQKPITPVKTLSEAA